MDRDVYGVGRRAGKLQVIRTVLALIGSKLDGTPAAASTISRKRAVFHNVLEYAIERGLRGMGGAVPAQVGAHDRGGVGRQREETRPARTEAPPAGGSAARAVPATTYRAAAQFPS